MSGLREFAEQQAEVGARVAARAVRDADAEHRGPADGGGARADAGRRAAPTSRRSRCATRCACSSPRRSRSSPRPARASCASGSRRRRIAAAVAILDRALVRSCRPFRSRSSAGSPAATSPGPTSRTRCDVVRRAERARRSWRRSTCSARRSRASTRRAAIAAPTTTSSSDRPRGARLERLGEAHRPRARARPATSAATNLEALVARRARRAATSSASTWRTRPRPTTRSASTASSARPATSNVGVVLQATLRRTLADVDALADLRPNVRVCKGIYIEPPAIAFREYEAVRANFVRALEALLDAGCYVGHRDARRVADRARRERRSRSAGSSATSTSSRCCSACVRSSATRSSREGTGCASTSRSATHWYRYSLRRLQENPRSPAYVAADTFGRLLHPLRNGAVIWARAEGCRVWRLGGARVPRPLGGFGVAALGHRNPRDHGGDRGAAGRACARRSRGGRGGGRAAAALPWPAKFGVTGEDAVEIALRTALLATGRPGIVAFGGAYHGTGLLALAATRVRALPRAVSRVAARAGAPVRVRRRSGPAACGRRLCDRRARAGPRRRARPAGRLAGVAPRAL